MPEWAQLIMGVAAVITALGVLWTKVLRPGARLISTTEEMLPLLRKLTVTFRDTPESFAVLGEIAAQFKSDSGSSLRDVVNRLEEMATENKRLLDISATELRNSDETLKVGVETSKQLAALDRESHRQLMLVVDRLNIKIDELQVSGAVAVTDRAEVAERLVERERVIDKATTGVALDLAADKQRADTTEGAVGAAADAAAVSTPAVERRRLRQEAEYARRIQWEIDQANGDEEETDERPIGDRPRGTE